MHIGAVCLRVADLEGMKRFYSDDLGLPVMEEGSERAVLGFEEPVLVLEAGGVDRSHEEAGLFHVAFRVADREALARLLHRLEEHDVALSGASDHGVSEALYLEDPEGNGIELYRDRPQEDWRYEDGDVVMETERLDLDDLRSEADGTEVDAMTVGHVHLEVMDLEDAERFYREELDMEVMARVRGAVFLSDGEYHHYVGLNTWNHRSEPCSAESRGLAWFELVPDGAEADHMEGAEELTDPSGIRVRPRSQNE
jgi:catechol 2,3-dioxygenase